MTMTTLLAGLLTLLPLGAQGLPDAPLPQAAAQEPGVLAITNAHLHPVSSEPIEGGTLLVEDGRIVAIGAGIDVPAGARVVDVGGRHVIPGLVETHSHMGLKQLWTPGTGANNNELSRSINAAARVQDGVNARDIAFEIALAAGVTTMNITPGSRSPNSGQAVVAKLRAPTIDEMAFAHGGMKFAIRVPERSSTFDGDEEDVRELLRSQFLDAREYLAARRAWEEGRAAEAPPRDLTLEAFGKLLEREWPVGVHAHGVPAMTQAMLLKDEFDLDLYIHHGGATGSVVDELLRLDVPVSFGPVLPGRHRHHGQIDGFVEFVEGGGLLALHQDHSDGPQYYLREAAALFVRRGMPAGEALAALTLNPARILGVDHRVGSLEEGKDADFLLLSGPPLDWESRVERVFVEGREVYSLPESDRALLEDASAATSGDQDVDSFQASSGVGAGGEAAAVARLASPDVDLALVGGEIRTMSGEMIADGTVLVADGVIVDVGPDLDVPAGARVVDARGLVVTPGLIDARTSLGASSAEPGGSVAPPAASRNGHHWLRDGVTAVYAAPSDREAIGGFGGVVKLAGSDEARMVSERTALGISLGDNALGRGDGPTTRQGLVAVLRQQLLLAGEAADPDLAPALRGEVPVRIVAHRPDDILAALRLAREFDLRLVVDVASGAHQVAGHLAEAGVPVVVGPSMEGHGGGGPLELFAHTPWNAGRLYAAGVPVAFSTDGSGGRSVTLEALLAVGHGVPAGAALHAATLGAAQILGVDDRLGSIEAGKDADLVLWDGEPISTWSEARIVVVGGEVVVEAGELAGSAGGSP